LRYKSADMYVGRPNDKLLTCSRKAKSENVMDGESDDDEDEPAHVK